MTILLGGLVTWMLLSLFSSFSILVTILLLVLVSVVSFGQSLAAIVSDASPTIDSSWRIRRFLIAIPSFRVFNSVSC